MKNIRPLPNLENDYRVFLWFLTLTTIGMYVWVLTTNPAALRDPRNVIICSVLLVIYIGLHWFTNKIYCHAWMVAAYILVQGALAFTISVLSGIEVMIFALFLALIGECIGMFGLSRRSLIGCVYYLALSLASFAVLNGPGSALWWLIGTAPAVLFVGIYVTLYNRQTEANERARTLLDELESANQQLSSYAAQVEDLTIAAERQRMARELHDTLSQGLAGLILQLEAADAHLAHERPEKARQIVQQTMTQARQTLSEARRAIDDLRQAAESTLEEAMRRSVERFTTAAGIVCDLQMDLPGEVPQGQREAINRILAEALNNIQQHAQSKRVMVELCGEQDGGVRLEIADDGVGFDPSTTPPGHYGLIGMRERARLAGGSMEVESRPGAGTRLVVHFPQKEPAAAVAAEENR